MFSGQTIGMYFKQQMLLVKERIFVRRQLCPYDSFPIRHTFTGGIQSNGSGSGLDQHNNKHNRWVYYASIMLACWVKLHQYSLIECLDILKCIMQS